MRQDQESALKTMVTNNNLTERFLTKTSKLPEGQTLAKFKAGSTIFYWKSLSLTWLLQNCHLLHNIDHEMTSFHLGKVRQDIKALQQALPGKAVMLADIVPKGGSGRGYSSSFNVFSLFVKENCDLVAYLCRNSDRHAHVLSIQYPFFHCLSKCHTTAFSPQKFHIQTDLEADVVATSW